MNIFVKPRCIQNFQAWLYLTRYFRRLGVKIAGKYYNDNRPAIKREIRARVSAVLNGFDLTLQTQLFSSDVAVLAENSRRLELGLGELRVMA
jgi:hypothetical protein